MLRVPRNIFNFIKFFFFQEPEPKTGDVVNNEYLVNAPCQDLANNIPKSKFQCVTQSKLIMPVKLEEEAETFVQSEFGTIDHEFNLISVKVEIEDNV